MRNVKLSLDMDLRDNHTIHFQPIIQVRPFVNLFGFELLSRHARTGEFPKPLYDLHAKNSYQMMTWDKWVIEQAHQACLRHFQRTPNYPFVFVNVQPTSLLNREYKEVVETRFYGKESLTDRKCFFPAQHLRFEISEKADIPEKFLKNAAESYAGLPFARDDAQCVSIESLSELGTCFIKIEHTVIDKDELLRNRIVKAICGIASNYYAVRPRIVFEGIETKADLAYVLQWPEIEFIQGYLRFHKHHDGKEGIGFPRAKPLRSLPKPFIDQVDALRTTVDRQAKRTRSKRGD